MQTTRKQWTTGTLALMLATGTVGARAQMDDGPPPPPPGAPGMPPRDMPPRDMPPGGGKRGGARRTPEQMQAQRAQMLKRMLESAGITDEKTPPAIAAYVGEREAATRALQEKMRAVGMALHSGATTDKEIAAVLDNLRGAVAAEKTRRARAEKDLDAQIGFSRNPRLDAILTMMGLVGDEASVVGGGGPGGMRGGRGPGMNGGRRGGPNGGPPPGAPGDR